MCTAEAQKSTMYYKVGAIIVDKNGNVIGKGYNLKLSTHPEKVRISIHAEQMAISRAPKKELKNATLYVARITEGGSGISRTHPCKKCITMITKHNIRRVYYPI